MNTVSALAEEGSAKAPPGRRWAQRSQSITRRTTLTFDSTGLARVGMIPRHGRAIIEFADLTQRSIMSARVGHRALSPADLVAVVAECLIGETLLGRPHYDAHGSEAGIVLTYPARYTETHIGDLRASLDAIGLDRVELVAEPIAAVAWLESDRGPLMPGLALVYDLGGASLDVTLVRVGAGCPSNPIAGQPMHSAEYGGRAFGALVASRAGRGLPSASISGSVTGTTADELRTEHVRASLELVYRCLRAADVTMADVDCVVVVGGAARPVEVAQVLAGELARPVIVAPDPERTIADGAAIIGRRAAVAAEESAGKHHGKRRQGAHRRAATRAMVLSQRTKQRLSRVALAAGLSVAGIGMALALPADGVVVGLAQLGLR
ncbi:Hsp70 family protein [Nocardia sp. NPDC006044]|uniref:Hsp70 family protein n=1 Tax=Nocardia sp. NPDC006044 TaxID=3364306 RepID=UPI00367C320E